MILSTLHPLIRPSILPVRRHHGRRVSQLRRNFPNIGKGSQRTHYALRPFSLHLNVLGRYFSVKRRRTIPISSTPKVFDSVHGHFIPSFTRFFRGHDIFHSGHRPFQKSHQVEDALPRLKINHSPLRTRHTLKPIVRTTRYRRNHLGNQPFTSPRPRLTSTPVGRHGASFLTPIVSRTLPTVRTLNDRLSVNPGRPSPLIRRGQLPQNFPTTIHTRNHLDSRIPHHTTTTQSEPHQTQSQNQP